MSSSDSISRLIAADPRHPVVLCVLDGWGYREAGADNAIAAAETPNWDRLWRGEARALLGTSGESVGLPAGQMGNSEVGHQTIGAGRIVLQDLPRIDKAIADGALANRPALAAFIADLRASGGTCHLMGLCSPGGVHAHQDHIVALARAVAAAGVPVCLHAFLDGRDTPPCSADGYLADIAAAIADSPGIAIASLSGRYFAMDRDKRWDRVERAYRALVDGDGARRADSAAAAIAQAYAADENDEFVQPTLIADYAGIADGDGLLMANFRADRAREILAALLDPGFDGFARRRGVAFAASLGMVSYSDALDPLIPALFASHGLADTLGERVAAAGRTQLRLAETEKYAHVTFFLNGGEERTFPGEERILVPSAKVATYDLQPQMSAPAVTEALVRAIRQRKHDLIVVNYANPDMVGHTGIWPAALAAVRTIDAALGAIEAALREVGGTMLLTADHGNIEQMQDPDSGDRHTAHTTNPVPLVCVNAPAGLALRDGSLADVAPTVLTLMGLGLPDAMTGTCLLRPAAEEPRHRAAG